MRRTRMLALTGTAALIAAIAGSANATAVPSAPAAAVTGSGSYVVLADAGADASAIAAKLRAAGGTVTSVNTDIGLITVKGSSALLTKARAIKGVEGAAGDRSIGRSPKTDKKDAVLKEHAAAAAAGKGKGKSSSSAGTKGSKHTADPLDDKLWGMDMIDAPEAHEIEMGDKRVRVGILDTGVQGDHPDIAPNFDKKLSRNFTTDMTDVDGPCEVASCVDGPGVDDNGHGTHVAGTIAAAMNGIGVSGVAPEVGIVNIRGGQDSGYFFLGPVTSALTYAGDTGIDVVNMSFYVDPWLYNCEGGAPEDSPEEAAEQDVIIAAMNRALEYAHSKDVTLVGALGNNHEDLSNPRTDFSSPDYPGGTEHPRTIDNATCWDLPTEGPHVIGVSALGPSGEKADYSNYATDLTSGEIEVSAPGGWFRDGIGTATYRTNENLILSAAPLHVLQAEGQVDEAGNITPDGQALGTIKDCGFVRGKQVCGYYQYLQGTSMAAPHASGVAALAVSAHGKVRGKAGFTLTADKVRDLLMGTATDHACPAGGVRSYEPEGRSPEFTATCNGTVDFNSFYGDGIVNALGVVQ
ncbi:S8 family serine peptidase [Knoellia sp. S7-12]|uniref:S8 family serine peptidase n=1 Tax=Knoellia sp. S7-12 TaxID=3126698 RepID=UPI00336834CD